MAIDESWARRHGYGSRLRAAQERAQAADPRERELAAAPPARRAAYLAALNGTPRDPSVTVQLPDGSRVGHSRQGCVAEADARLYGDYATWFRVSRVTDQLLYLRRSAVVADPRFTAALPRWSACMHAAGEPVSTPSQARELAQQQGFRRERVLAVAEARCASSTGLAALVGRLDAEHERRLEARYRTELALRRTLQRHAVAALRGAGGERHS